MAFEVELGFEGLVDRLDDLAERSQESLSGSQGFFAEGGSDEGDAAGVEFGLEAGRAVSLVGHQDLAGSLAERVVEFEHCQCGVAFVGFGAGQRVGDREPGGCRDEVAV